MLILGIESSCDETAAAVLDEKGTIRANVVNSQIAVHEKFGGVVPEIASRHHLKNILPVVNRSLADAGAGLGDIGLVAATRGPGLVGALLVGYSFARALAFGRNIPFVGVDHLKAHLLSVFLGPEPHPRFPFTALLVSGGHTALFLVRSPVESSLLGTTVDDAAGEAFDKVAKILGLGYPGGPVISREAEKGDPAAIAFPRPLADSGDFNFSFSGLKTAVITEFGKMGGKVNRADFCASFQEAVADVLSAKAVRAAGEHGGRLVAAGGVAANPRLREKLAQECFHAGIELFLPPLSLCTDNGAMIAHAGLHLFRTEGETPPDADVYSRSSFKAD